MITFYLEEYLSKPSSKSKKNKDNRRSLLNVIPDHNSSKLEVESNHKKISDQDELLLKDKSSNKKIQKRKTLKKNHVLDSILNEKKDGSTSTNGEQIQNHITGSEVKTSKRDSKRESKRNSKELIEDVLVQTNDPKETQIVPPKISTKKSRRNLNRESKGDLTIDLSTTHTQSHSQRSSIEEERTPIDEKTNSEFLEIVLRNKHKNSLEVLNQDFESTLEPKKKSKSKLSLKMKKELSSDNFSDLQFVEEKVREKPKKRTLKSLRAPLTNEIIEFSEITNEMRRRLLIQLIAPENCPIEPPSPIYERNFSIEITEVPSINVILFYFSFIIFIIFIIFIFIFLKKKKKKKLIPKKHETVVFLQSVVRRYLLVKRLSRNLEVSFYSFLFHFFFFCFEHFNLGSRINCNRNGTN